MNDDEIPVAIKIVMITAGINPDNFGKSKIKEIQKRKRKSPTPKTKKLIKNRQNGRCINCNECPTHWAFHHLGEVDNNEPEYIVGMCLDCHTEITISEPKDLHTKIE